DVEIDVDEALQLDRQQLTFPAGVEGELIVGQYIGAPLSRVQMSQAHRRDTVQAEQLCRLDPAMAGDDRTVLSDQNRVVESELPDALGDLPDLFLGMGSGIAGMRPQARHGHRFYRHGLHGFSSFRIVSEEAWSGSFASSKSL